MDNLGHLTGMLDRDQRTAKLRFFSDKDVEKTYSFPEKTTPETNVNPNSIISHRHWCSPSRTKIFNSSYLTWKNGYLLKSFHRLTKVLIVGVYLTLVILPITTAAPVNKKMGDRLKETPKWKNPCGITQDNTDIQPDHSSPSLVVSERVLLNQIVNQANVALTNAKKFKDQFADKTFGMPYEDVHQLFRSQPPFLNIDLPKSLGEEIPKEILETLTIDKTLLDVYELLQKVAVGLEQIVLDQQDNQGLFAKDFGEAELFLLNVLCEIQMVIIERGITMRPYVERSIMPETQKHLNVSETKSRDWKIFREYMNSLEYTIGAITHLMTTMQ